MISPERKSLVNSQHHGGLESLERIVKDEHFLFWVSIALFTCVASWKLLNSSLWFDEGIEYWYSKRIIGSIPFNGDAAYGTSNMYERVISTFQPPLYNFIVHFWIKISDTEWWFRLFGIVCGIACVVGIYRVVHELANHYAAALSVLLSSFTYQLCYYFQECAEYCLLLAFVSWTIYFFVKSFSDSSIRCQALFTLFCVLSIWTQYGAALLCFPMAIILFIHIARQRNGGALLHLGIIYAVAGICAGFPLWHFFLKAQLNNGNSNAIVVGGQAAFGIQSIVDAPVGLITVIRWLLFPRYSEPVANLLTCLFVFAIIGSCIIEENKQIRALVMALFISYLFYYIVVKLGVYSYGTIIGGWENARVRYVLFILPLVLVLLTLSARSLILLAQRVGKHGFHMAVLAVGCVVLFSYVSVNWFNGLQANWKKSEMRELTDEWYEHVREEEAPTVVYYGADACFSYYLRHDKRYDASIEKDVTYMDWNAWNTKDEYSKVLKQALERNAVLPQSVYFVISHQMNDIDTILSSFESMGYVETWHKDRVGAKLLFLSRPE